MSTDPRLRVLTLLRRFGFDATSFQVLERGFAYWFDDEAEACVAYVDTGRAWVAAGAPIADSADLAASAERFVEAARMAGKRVCFFAVEDRLVVNHGGLASMTIGEEPSWDPLQWPEIVRRDRKLREQLRRARAKGVVVRALPHEEIGDSEARALIEELVREWLASRKMPPLGFLVDVQIFDFAEERRWFLATQEGKIVGLLVAVPVYRRNGWLFEDLLRPPHAPNGTNEALIDCAMRKVAEEGSRFVTLGLAPLAGDVSPWLRKIRAASSVLYDFDGVRKFKAKLRPHDWRPLHLAWPRHRSGGLALVDSLSAFTKRAKDGHERGSFVRFGLETLAHAPGIGIRLLAFLLVPWTLALALAPTSRFFPSALVQIGWVSYHCGLAALMWVLARRWRSSLARGLAIAISMGAALTIAEVLCDAGARARSSLDIAFLVLACTGPVLAAFQLWGAIAWRNRQCITAG